MTGLANLLKLLVAAGYRCFDPMFQTGIGTFVPFVCHYELVLKEAPNVTSDMLIDTDVRVWLG